MNDNNVPILDKDDIDVELDQSIDPCSICLEEIATEAECINNCGHRFCKPCLDQYLDLGKTECPLCRQKIQYFEHNSEHFRLILKKVTQIRAEPPNPNTVVVDRKKINFVRFICIGLLVTNIINMFMGDVYTAQQNILLKQYQDCERNITDLQSDIVNLEETITDISTSEYAYYFVIDKLRGLQTNCYLPVTLINTCFNIF